MSKKIELTEAEWQILEVVWQRGHCTAPDVQEALEPSMGWAYSTVKTLMDRMADKGLLETERIRKMILFRPGIKRIQAQRSELVRAARRAFSGAFSPIVEFLVEDNKLSKEELKHLEKLIRERCDDESAATPDRDGD